MKTVLPQAIATIEEAKKLLTDLYNNGECYHPEDDANNLHGDPFTEKEGEQLNKLMGDIYGLPGVPKEFDPCEHYLDLMKSTKEFFWKDKSGRGFNATFTWTDIKRIYETEYKKEWDAMLAGMTEEEKNDLTDESLYTWAWNADAGDTWSDKANHYTCTKS